MSLHGLLQRGGEAKRFSSFFDRQAIELEKEVGFYLKF
jgi:hypothetical protein